MQITRQADYAARAVLQLAQGGNNGPVSTSYVAKEQNIPTAFLPKIITQLSIAGILQTARGARGGIKLAREPKNITLLDVIEAIDGPMKLNVCVHRDGACVLEDNCPIQSVWCEVQKEFVARVQSIDFAQLTI